MVWVVSRFRLKIPSAISSSCISSGQRSRASWASHPQKSATLSPQPEGKPRKFIRTCGGIEKKIITISKLVCHHQVYDRGKSLSLSCSCDNIFFCLWSVAVLMQQTQYSNVFWQVTDLYTRTRTPSISMLCVVTTTLFEHRARFQIERLPYITSCIAHRHSLTVWHNVTLANCCHECHGTVLQFTWVHSVPNHIPPFV